MTFQVSLHVLAELDDQRREALFRRAETDLSAHIEAVRPIIDAVAAKGDEALLHYAKEFDGADLGEKGLLVSEREFDQARQKINPDLVETLELAAKNIREFHLMQLPKERQWQREIMQGVTVGERILPVASAACYCPRGKGSFPSVALMTTIPAVIAGVTEIILLTPPGPDGTVDAGTLVAARIAGVNKVARVGGAQAVAAAAFGTESVPKCRKFEGPGSPWLAAAKRVLADRISSRLPAGPSETIILADPTASAKLCALDMLIESEHGPDSSAFLVTWSRDLAEKIKDEIPVLLEAMGEPRRGYCQTVLSGDKGGIVLARDARAAYDFVNEYAPEHLQVMSKKPEQHLDKITNAAEILLGEKTPGSIANYMMGPNCVLPTNGEARVHSPLSVWDFVKTNTIGRLDQEGYVALAPHTKRFAEYEGFEGHANAVSSDREEGGDAKGKT